MMAPERPLPYSDDFTSAEQYVEELLRFASSSLTFQTFSGGVHIMDFFTSDPGLFFSTVPHEWHEFLRICTGMNFVDFLLRDDLDVAAASYDVAPPRSLIEYVKQIRRLSLDRSFKSSRAKPSVIPRHVAVGMKLKKMHEITHFADYVDHLAGHVSSEYGQDITHLVDFGSGQNYLGRTLASPPYSRNVVAVEGRKHNVEAAKKKDVHAKLALKPVVLRNKKVWVEKLVNDGQAKEKLVRRAQKTQREEKTTASRDDGDWDKEAADLRPFEELGLETVQATDVDMGSIQYVEGQLHSGDLSHIVDKIHPIENVPAGEAEAESPPGEESGQPQPKPDQHQTNQLMAVSVHSCGNLSHYGIRSLVLNPDIRAVAIIGCCYNLMTEKLGPVTYKFPYQRPSTIPINGRVARESEAYDPEGFPISERVSTYNQDGIRLNITARMMACQAPSNWTAKETDDFLKRHYYRAVLQRIFIDTGVVSWIHYEDSGKPAAKGGPSQTQFSLGTNPVMVGALRKGSHDSLRQYVRAAIQKLTTHRDCEKYEPIVTEKLHSLTDEDIARYEELYGPRLWEVSAVWCLMAFSAQVVESLITTDRWLYLREHGDIVQESWVETVFDYKESPRNLVVVGIKK